VAATPHGHHADIQSTAYRDHEGRTRRGKKLPLEQEIPAIKAILAECILKAAAAEGQKPRELGGGGGRAAARHPQPHLMR
jgi:hypothetical protein